MELRDYLIEKQLTQKDFAKICCVSRSYMSQIIKGTRIPSLAMAHLIENKTYGRVKATSLVNRHKVKHKNRAESKSAGSIDLT